MGTADSNEYNKRPCHFKQYMADEAAATKRFNRRVWLETKVSILAIFGYCALQANIQQRYLKADLAEQTKAREATCQIKQYNIVHQCDCVILNKKLSAAK